MKVKSGTYRRAVVFRSLTIKFPRTRLLKALKNLWDYRKRPKWLLKFLTRGSDYQWSVQWAILRGVFDNWREHQFYKSQGFPILAPSLFSLFGIVNVQRTAQEIQMEDVDLWVQFHQITGGAVWKNSHVFAEKRNFGILDGKLVIVDYGSRRTQEILKEYHEKMSQEFDFGFS